VTSQIDVQSFVQAAIFEERQMSENGEETEELLHYASRPLKPSGLSFKRQMAYHSPRLAVLNKIPFAIPFEARVSIFRNFISNDMTSRGRIDRFSSGRTRAVIRRDKIAQDGFDRLQDANLKQPLEIVFIDQFGQEEYVCFGAW
jgi:ubiquitin-protein ligase E3 C